VQKEDYKIVTIRLNLGESAGRTTFLSNAFLEKIKSAGLQKHSIATQPPMLFLLPQSDCPRAPMSRFLLSSFNLSSFNLSSFNATGSPNTSIPKDMFYGRFRAVEVEVSASSGRDRKEGAQLMNLNLDGDQLYLKAMADTESSKDRIWDAIKKVDPTFADLKHDIEVKSGVQRYTVQSGDSLSKIAKHFYGDAQKFTVIARGNDIANPDLVKVGGGTGDSGCLASLPPSGS
jgi:hypothetical protein